MVNVNGWDSGLLVAFGVASISVYCQFFTAQVCMKLACYIKMRQLAEMLKHVSRVNGP
jgi:hypothetical protein